MRIVHLGTGSSPPSRRTRLLRRAETLLGRSEFSFDTPTLGSRARNAGDKLLTESFQFYIRSELQASDAPYLNCRKRFTEAHVRAINTCEGLVVGGGGLLLFDTFPNLQSDWQWGITEELIERIDVPIWVMAIGYNAFRGQRPFTKAFDRTVSALVRKSAFFSLRHRGDLEKTKRHLDPSLQEKLKLHYCPTLCYNRRRWAYRASLETKHVGICLAGDRLGHRHRDPLDYLKKIGELRSILQTQCRQRVSLILHGSSDRWVLEYLPFDSVVDMSIMDSSEIYRTYSMFDCVISDRGHGQMLPFAVGCRILTPISHDKLKFFLEDIEMEDCGVEAEDPNLVERMVAAFQGISKDDYLSRWTEAMRQIEANYEEHLATLRTWCRETRT